MGSPLGPAFEIGVVTFDGTDSAERLVASLRERGAVGDSNEVGLLEHHTSGRFSVHSYTPEATTGLHVGEGALIGALAGALVLGPFGLVAGMIGGGAVGLSMGGAKAHDLQLSGDFMARLKDALPPGSSAVLIVGEPEVVDQFMGEIRSSDAVAKVELREPLSQAQATAIREAIERHRSG
jgi:uncharacterized membrane protein